MRRRTTVASIDVGSTKVAVIVGDIGEHGETRILGVGVSPAAGLTRGVIDNIQSAREAVHIAVEKAEAPAETPAEAEAPAEAPAEAAAESTES